MLWRCWGYIFVSFFFFLVLHLLIFLSFSYFFVFFFSFSFWTINNNKGNISFLFSSGVTLLPITCLFFFSLLLSVISDVNDNSIRIYTYSYNTLSHFSAVKFDLSPIHYLINPYYPLVWACLSWCIVNNAASFRRPRDCNWSLSSTSLGAKDEVEAEDKVCSKRLWIEAGSIVRRSPQICRGINPKCRLVSSTS